MGDPAAAPPLPRGARDVIERLRAAGRRAVAAGEPLHALARGRAPRAVLVVTDAPAPLALRCLPRAVPTAPALAAAAVPTSTGPVDLAFAERLEEWLAARDFSVHALGFDPVTGAWLDPCGGLADLRAGRLRTARPAAETLAAEPLVALRAGRVVASFGYRPDPSLEAAMAGAPPPPVEALRAALRGEIFALLLAPHVRAGLDLLRRTGVEQALAPGTQPDAGAVLERLPRDRALRLAGWLRGARATRLLQRWRVPRNVAWRAALLLRHHPVELQAEPRRDVSVRRLLRRAGSGLEALFALREAELAAGALEDDAGVRKRLDALRAALERVSEADRRAALRTRLALDGAAVMAALDTGPGPMVGRALRHLADWVQEDPSRNEPGALRAELRRWAAREPRPPGVHPSQGAS